MTFVHRSMRQRAADAAAGVRLDPEAAALRRGHTESALTALRLLIEGNPRLAALMASRPALAPLLDCMEPSCRCRTVLQPNVCPLRSKVTAHLTRLSMDRPCLSASRGRQLHLQDRKLKLRTVATPCSASMRMHSRRNG